MPSPRGLIHALYTHWDVIERLVLLGREHPAFEQDQVLAVIRKLAVKKSVDECEATLRQLISSDLLQLMPRSTAAQVHPLVLELVRGLTHEHELGLSAVLKARIEEIKSAASRLTEGLNTKDSDLLRQAATQLSELFRQINQQLNQDRHAILELAERAKSNNANLPIERRYREILAAFDNYVAPMAEMMDSGPSGTFYRHLEAAEHALDNAVETLTVQGSLYTQRMAMRQVAFQAKETRRLGREVLKHCSDTLLPLREDIRQHNLLSSAISTLLSQIRKRGLNATLPASALPLWRRDNPRRITVGNEVISIMAEALSYEPVTFAFPNDDEIGDTHLSIDRIDEAALVEELTGALPVENLLRWLHERYPDFGDATLLRLYHAVIERHEWSVAAAATTAKQPLNTILVTHYPHSLGAVLGNETGAAS
jgi:hypothetical protein